jgi:hypothetical protein
VEVTEIRWGAEDALPFPLCISAETGESDQRRALQNVSVALGNILLVDHGMTKHTSWDRPLGVVPSPSVRQLPAPNGSEPAQQTKWLPARFRPVLPETPLTQATPYTTEDASGSAHIALQVDAHRAMPAIKLYSLLNEREETWHPQRDLLNSGPLQPEFVVEVESDGRTYLRFGDDQHGMRPNADTKFRAEFRLGNGDRGNIGANTLAHIVTRESAIAGVTNPMPASGGQEPESLEQARQNAPSAFRTPERAVTPADYALRAAEQPGVQKAAASLRWTGSWHTMFLSVDRVAKDSHESFDSFEKDLRARLAKFRMAGHDLEIEEPKAVALELGLHVRVKPEYFRNHIARTLSEIFSSRVQRDGSRGIFHPDNFTFGQTVYLSPLIAAAQAVEGVESVRAVVFQRQDAPGEEALNSGQLALGRLEIARLENDPNFPDHGLFRLTLEGGK